MTEPIIKKCYLCGSSENGFYKNENRCKVCRNKITRKWHEEHPERSYLLQRDSYDKTLYGLPKGSRERMLKEQNGECAICGQVPTTRRGLAIDHDHETGQVRGLLCHGCNIAIGNFGDDIELMQKAIDYLSAFGK